MEAGHNVWVCAPMVLAEYQLGSWVQKQNSGQWQCAILSWSFWAILRTQRAPRNAVEDKWTDGLQAGACGEQSIRWCIKLRDIPKWPVSLEMMVSLRRTWETILWICRFKLSLGDTLRHPTKIIRETLSQNGNSLSNMFEDDHKSLDFSGFFDDKLKNTEIFGGSNWRFLAKVRKLLTRWGWWSGDWVGMDQISSEECSNGLLVDD